jgi:hypothetical protein
MNAVIKQIKENCSWVERGRESIGCCYNCLYVFRNWSAGGHYFLMRGCDSIYGGKFQQEHILNMYRDIYRTEYQMLPLNYWFSNANVLKRGYFSSARERIHTALVCILVKDLIDIVNCYYSNNL